MDRKKFLQKAGLATAGILGLPQLVDGSAALPVAPPIYSGDNEGEYWKSIREQYIISEGLINLNNGSVGPQPIPVMQAFLEKYQYANQAPSYYIWNKLNNDRGTVRERLAEKIGASANEVAICRNTTEALNTVIFGLQLSKGDEVVLTTSDYPFAMNAWRQREARDGIVLKWVQLDLPEEDEEVIVNKFVAAMSDKTKVLHVTYIQNWTGQILPVKKLSEVAHANGAQILIDAAHAFAQQQHSVKEIGADYYATSLHKWLGAPFGTGFLYVKADLIKALWPLHSSYEHDSDDIIKLEQLGTRDVAAEMCILDALDFHEQIGIERISQRLKFLKQYWYEQVAELHNLTLFTTRSIEHSCALASIAVKGKLPHKVKGALIDSAGLHVGIVHWDDKEGIRVSPHIYTSTNDLDELIKQIKILAK